MRKTKPDELTRFLAYDDLYNAIDKVVWKLRIEQGSAYTITMCDLFTKEKYADRLAQVPDEVKAMFRTLCAL